METKDGLPADVDGASVDTTGGENTLRVFLLTLVAALGGFLFGFDSGVINGTVDALQQTFDSDEVGTGFNVASMLLGCAAGAFFAGSLADKFGRRPVMLATACAFIVSSWGSGMSGLVIDTMPGLSGQPEAIGSAEFVFFRILGGLAVGGASILAPAYISEIAPARIRGRLTTMQQLMIVTGLFMAFVSNYFIAQSAGTATETFMWGYDAWRWMYWVEILPASLFLLGLIFIPESPRYLVGAGREEEAQSVLETIIRPEVVTERIQEIRETVERATKPSLRDLISRHTGRVHPIVWVGIGLAALQQFTGINVVFYYGAVLWQAAGFTEAGALLTNVTSGAINIAFTFVAIALVDKLGRKPLLLGGALGQAAMLGVMALAFGFAGEGGAETLQLEGMGAATALIAAHLYIAFFAATWGPIMWVMLGEMFPNRFRGAALAVCGVSQWLSNFTITMTFPILLSSIGLGLSYALYAFFGVVAYFFVRWFIQETKGRTLEDMSREHDEAAAKAAREATQAQESADR